MFLVPDAGKNDPEQDYSVILVPDAGKNDPEQDYSVILVPDAGTMILNRITQ